MFKKIAKIFGAAPTKDISGERLYEHLKNIGIDAEVIPEGSQDDPGPDRSPQRIPGNKYSFSIKVKGLHFDVIQINRYARDPYSTAGYDDYRTDYIVRDSGEKIEDLKRNSRAYQFLLAPRVSLDWKNHCVRMYSGRMGFITYHETIISKEERVKYVFLKDDKFPSLETLEDYDKKAWQVRRMLESGQLQWDQPE